MFDWILGLIAPHICFGCGKTGALLCDNCKYDIISEAAPTCIVCGVMAGRGVCSKHRLPYSTAWCVGLHADVLGSVIGVYKFQRVRNSAGVLAELLSEHLPELPSSAVIVPVPTIARHIRQRGYDHTLLVARKLARRKEISCQQMLIRNTSTKQIGASRQVRMAQAKRAFSVKGAVSAEKIYVVVDDVYTTGATLRYAAKALKEAGADEVWVAVVARQPST